MSHSQKLFTNIIYIHMDDDDDDDGFRSKEERVPTS